MNKQVNGKRSYYNFLRFLLLWRSSAQLDNKEKRLIEYGREFVLCCFDNLTLIMAILKDALQCAPVQLAGRLTALGAAM